MTYIRPHRLTLHVLSRVDDLYDLVAEVWSPDGIRTASETTRALALEEVGQHVEDWCTTVHDDLVQEPLPLDGREPF